MKHHAMGRPIGKCKGCSLNLRTVCAAGVDPRSEWTRGRCRKTGDSDALEVYLNPPSPVGALAAKLQRRRRAAQAATMPHYNGHIPVVVRSRPAPR